MYSKFRPLKLLFFILFISFTALFAQQTPLALAKTHESVAALKTRLANTKDPTEAIQLLGFLADSAAVSNLPALRGYASQALAWCGDKAPKLLQARAQLLVGKAYVRLTSYDTAIVFLDRALALFGPRAHQEESAEAHYWIGQAKANQREFDAAAEHYFKAVAIWERSGYRKELARTYTVLADLQAMQDDYEKAINYSQQAIGILKTMDEPALLVDALLYLSYTYVLKGEPANGLKYASQAIGIVDRIAPNGLQAARASNVRGNANKFLGNYAAALRDYERSKNISEKLGLKRGVMASEANTGHTLLLQKRYDQALPHTLRAIELMHEIGEKRNLRENLHHAADSYAGLGDYAKAYHYMTLYRDEREREYDQTISALKDGLSDKYEAGQRAATIAMQKEQIEKQNKFQLLLWGFVALSLLTSLLIYLGLRSRQKTNRLLGATNQQLEKRNQENELLLKEIHHRVKNNLEMVSSLLLLQSRQVDDPSVREVMEEGQQRVQSIGIVHQKLYQGDNLSCIEMKDYFINLSEGILDTFAAEDRIQIECIMDKLELDVDTAVPLGLIVNELLTNALKYAFPNGQSGVVKIQLEATDADSLRLEVADNGVGKTAQTKGTGFGSQLIALLTQQLGGTLQEEVQNGTLVRLEFKKNRAA
jgi:two-component sensor histidine kinase